MTSATSRGLRWPPPGGKGPCGPRGHRSSAQGPLTTPGSANLTRIVLPLSPGAGGPVLTRQCSRPGSPRALSPARTESVRLPRAHAHPVPETAGRAWTPKRLRDRCSPPSSVPRGPAVGRGGAAGEQGGPGPAPLTQGLPLPGKAADSRCSVKVCGSREGGGGQAGATQPGAAGCAGGCVTPVESSFQKVPCPRNPITAQHLHNSLP